MPPKRFTANPLAAPRYRPGKPLPAADASSESESESDSASDDAPAQREAPPKAASFRKIDVDLKAREAQAVASRAREAAERKRREEEEEGFVTASSSEGEEEGSDDEESGSESEAEDYSSDEEGRRRFIAPTFVRKGRVEKRDEGREWAEEERRRKEKADEMLRAQIEREVRERAEGKRDWDDEEVGDEADVDDRDGVDPEAEHAAWKLRELKRVKRERETIEVAEKEREEVERRRGLTQEERDREDKEWIDKQKEEKEGRGKMSYMQKYFHKGAFFQEDGDEEVKEAKRRDVAGRRFEDEAANRELLPQYMQIRDMTKLGKKGRTRYKDMKAEDTGSFGADLRDRRGRGDAGGRYNDGPSGANNVAVGERRPRDDDRGGREEKRPRYE
ncbi:hypothetical protein CAC42_2394 [Sphaceloma murrayae]|uniref:Micro-fibrillar-associated protein 1 C-terminal domain-containing protein n=1 Tax=Sphaceloma murrayae TaxID=2082308 RepID=A0A2K1QVY2_9PEZI|nr:hypothetical protein CAC42_2394 [Sphaceloma murrayae]